MNNNKKIDKIFESWIKKSYINEKVNVIRAIEIAKNKKISHSEIMHAEKFIEDHKYEVDWNKTNSGFLKAGFGYDKHGKIIKFAGIGAFNE